MFNILEVIMGLRSKNLVNDIWLAAKALQNSGEIMATFSHFPELSKFFAELWSQSAACQSLGNIGRTFVVSGCHLELGITLV